MSSRLHILIPCVLLKALLFCALLNALCRVREQVCIIEGLLWDRVQLINEQGKAIRNLAEVRSKLRYLQTEGGKRTLARMFGYIEEGEKLIQPLGIELSDEPSLVDELPTNVDEEERALLNELRVQFGKERSEMRRSGEGRLCLPVPTAQLLKRFERIQREKERVSKWLNMAAGILWIGVMP
ncbi:MAG: hypothetical protein RMK18_03665 [Armatimonadota bacterium]|nr:hypothetical protein [Armatimonadota bacterium]